MVFGLKSIFETPNCQLKCNMAMKLNIDENIVERCGSEEACGAWY